MEFIIYVTCTQDHIHKCRSTGFFFPFFHSTGYEMALILRQQRKNNKGQKENKIKMEEKIERKENKLEREKEERKL
jgi:hypothetical protein